MIFKYKASYTFLLHRADKSIFNINKVSRIQSLTIRMISVFTGRIAMIFETSRLRSPISIISRFKFTSEPLRAWKQFLTLAGSILIAVILVNVHESSCESVFSVCKPRDKSAQRNSITCKIVVRINLCSRQIFRITVGRVWKLNENENQFFFIHTKPCQNSYLFFWRISFYLSYSYKLSYFVRLLYYFLIIFTFSYLHLSIRLVFSPFF